MALWVHAREFECSNVQKERKKGGRAERGRGEGGRVGDYLLGGYIRDEMMLFRRFQHIYLNSGK